jgi:hypothetical protein
MKESSFENDIYFVTKPLHFASKILGLSPWHIDPKYKCQNERACFYIHASLAAIMVVLILFGMCDSFIYAGTYSDPIFNRFVCVLWIISVTTSHSASILALLLNATRNRNHLGNVLSAISRVDSKLLHTNCKHNVYMQQRSRIIRQMMFQFILHGGMSAFIALSFYNGTWTCLVYLVSQALTNVINILEILRYVNIVLIVKRRYQYIRQLLAEAAFTDDECTSTHLYTGHPLSHDSDKLFLSTRHNVKRYKDLRPVCGILDLRRIYSELYDVLHTSSRSYGVLILLDIITVLSNAVPTIYLAFVSLNAAAFSTHSAAVYLQGTFFLCSSSFGLMNFLWLTICCHTTTEVVQDTLVCVQKLLLYPNAFSWKSQDIERFSSQLKNLKVEFSVCGFFTLNLQFFCGTVGILFSYILVMFQLSRVV